MREVLTWDAFGTASQEVAQAIQDSDFEPDVVVAIARGGLLPAGAIAYALGVKLVGTMNVEFYSDIEQTLPDPIVLEPLLDTDAIAGKSVLVVDDVADTGRTLEVVLDLLRAHTDSIRSAVIYTKPSSVFAPDYSWRDTDRWIDFPWSALPNAVRL